jgi:hypothetical protein
MVVIQMLKKPMTIVNNLIYKNKVVKYIACHRTR